MITSRGVFGLVAAAAFMGSHVRGFTTTVSPLATKPWCTRSTSPGTIPASMRPAATLHTTLHAVKNDGSSDKSRSPRFLKRVLRLIPFRKAILRRAKPISFAILTVLSMDRMGSVGHTQHFFSPNAALASAPLPVTPRMQETDIEDDALRDYDKILLQRTQKELTEFRTRARQIEATEGVDARKQFEKEYQEAKAKNVEEKAEGLNQLKRDLLAQGICPRQDIEGERQVILYTRGIDLAEVQGSKFFGEKINEQRFPDRSWKHLKRPHRFILKCRVEDMQRRGVDPLEYYEENHRGETNKILDIPFKKALEIERQYKENLQKYDQITVPVEGEKIAPRGEMMTEVDPKAAAAQTKAAAKAKAKEEKAAAKARNAEAKAKAKAEKAAAKAKKAEEKAKAKEEGRVAKEAAKAAAAAAAGAAAATAGAAAKAAGDAVGIGADVVSPSAPGNQGSIVESPVSADSAEPTGEEAEAPTGTVAKNSVEKSPKKKSGVASLPIVPVSTFVVAAGGGGYAFKVYREKAAAEEEERQRQFKLIMGMNEDGGDDAAADSDTGSSWSAPALEEVGTDLIDEKSEDDADKEKPVEKAPEPAPEQPQKRKRGIKSMFSKKKNERETHLNKLLAPSATAPEFATLLAKILTFGAPGRFPQVVALPGGMPMENFDAGVAKEKLIEARATAGLAEEASAEVFANVVNCMLIDIVDLASSTLKEKDTKITVDAINVVVDFMNHAASLYDAVAPGVTITPVTYGGSLGNRKLEDMFRAYAVSEEVEQGKITLLQNVFSISDKKVEGIMMKDMQKKMMDMIKGMQDGDGEMTPEMEEMMKTMGGGMEGMGGMEGLAGMDGEEPSPEEAKQMLQQIKEMKDSGLLPKEELDQVRKEFEKMFGSGMDEIMAKADEDEAAMSPEEKEVMDLMKSILED